MTKISTHPAPSARSLTIISGFALAGFCVLMAFSVAARADDDDHERHHGHHHGWNHDDRGDYRDRYHERRYYAPPVEYGPGYAYPPPVYYGPSLSVQVPGLYIGVR